VLYLQLLTTSESTCSICQFTDSSGCNNSKNPFNTAFILGIPTSSGCSNTKVQGLADMEEITETGDNTTAIAALNPVCQGSRKTGYSYSQRAGLQHYRRKSERNHERSLKPGCYIIWDKVADSPSWPEHSTFQYSSSSPSEG
jgi:hypothetical protein